MTTTEILAQVAKLNERQKARLRSMNLNRLDDGDRFTVDAVGSDVKVFIRHAGFCHAVRLGPGGRLVSREVWMS